jgi:hypothetical protein
LKFYFLVRVSLYTVLGWNSMDFKWNSIFYIDFLSVHPSTL